MFYELGDRHGSVIPLIKLNAVVIVGKMLVKNNTEGQLNSSFCHDPEDKFTSPSPVKRRKESSQDSEPSTGDPSYKNSFPDQSKNSDFLNILESKPVPLKGKMAQNKYGLYKGITLAAISSIFFSLSSVIVKYMTEIHPGQLAVIRFLGILTFTLPIVVYKEEPVFGPRNIRHFLVLRGIVGATNLFLRFYAFRYLPIADASVIVFSVPVFVAIFARIFLKEPCGIFQVIAIIITLIGVFLITKMPLVLAEEFVYTKDRLYGLIAAVISTLFGAAVYIVIRRVKAVHHSVIMFNFGWVAIIETSIITVIVGNFSLARCGTNQWLIVLLGIFSFCGQTLLTMALQAEKAAAVSIVRSAVDIVLAFVWQILFFQEEPDIYSISGAILVSSCVLMISARKWLITLPEDSKTRKNLSCLLC